MRVLILILILAAFLQTTILPINLVLIILFLRSFTVSDKNNLYLAFGFGLLLSFLSLTPLGVQSIIFLLMVVLVTLLSRSSLYNHILVVVPLTIFFLVVNDFTLSFFIHESIHLWPKIFIESIFSLPIYLIIKFWDEKFIVRDIKLRVRS